MGVVEELQRLLGFLRNQETIDSIDPQPSLARINELIETREQSGLRITTDISGISSSGSFSIVGRPFRVSDFAGSTYKCSNKRA
jgi:hypothetical protein